MKGKTRDFCASRIWRKRWALRGRCSSCNLHASAYADTARIVSEHFWNPSLLYNRTMMELRLCWCASPNTSEININMLIARCKFFWSLSFVSQQATFTRQPCGSYVFFTYFQLWLICRCCEVIPHSCFWLLSVKSTGPLLIHRFQINWSRPKCFIESGVLEEHMLISAGQYNATWE